MSTKTLLILTTLYSLLTPSLFAEPIKLDKFEGAWHLRVLDGGEVRKARAILDFDAKRMQIHGFDGCNKIAGNLMKNEQSKTYSSELLTTNHMPCREKIHTYVSKRLQQAVKEGFSIKEESKYGVDGITIKSVTHELFFKKMGDS